MAKIVDLESWRRRATYEFFKDFEDPFFNLPAHLDATTLHRFCKDNRLSFALANLFYSLETANEIREFRLRIENETVLEYEQIHATQTVLNDDETFSFCYLERAGDVFEFCERGRAAIERYKRLKTFDVESDRVDLVYYSVIPWVSFTSFKHASRFDRALSVPRMVFGKLFDDGCGLKLPHSVEVHHALADGLHVGRYYERLQDKINNP